MGQVVLAPRSFIDWLKGRGQVDLNLYSLKTSKPQEPVPGGPVSPPKEPSGELREEVITLRTLSYFLYYTVFELLR